jgi:hypothetical protein
MVESPATQVKVCSAICAATSGGIGGSQAVRPTEIMQASAIAPIDLFTVSPYRTEGAVGDSDCATSSASISSCC